MKKIFIFSFRTMHICRFLRKNILKSFDQLGYTLHIDITVCSRISGMLKPLILDLVIRHESRCPKNAKLLSENLGLSQDKGNVNI